MRRRWLIGLVTLIVLLTTAAAIVLWPRNKLPFSFLTEAYDAGILKVVKHDNVSGKHHELWILTSRMEHRRRLTDGAARELERQGYELLSSRSPTWLLSGKRANYSVAFTDDTRPAPIPRFHTYLPEPEEGVLTIWMYLPKTEPTILDRIRSWLGL